MTVAIEPVVGDSTNTPQAARHILDMMQSPALVILDMSNLVNFEGKDNQQLPVGRHGRAAWGQNQGRTL